MISIATWLVREITQAAKESYPNECCGLLGGYASPDGEVTITRVQLSENVASEGIKDRFEVDPKVRFDLMRELENGPERIIGHYHSHPDHQAVPSQHDLKMAFEPDLLWLIVALSNGKVSDTRAHGVNDDASAFHEIPLTIN